MPRGGDGTFSAALVNALNQVTGQPKLHKHGFGFVASGLGSDGPAFLDKRIDAALVGAGGERLWF